MFGWPSNGLNEIEKQYISQKDSLHVDQGCLVWGYRIVIPKSLREKILREIHDGHPGIVKMKQIARNYVWWENLDADIERVAHECLACRSQRPVAPVAPLHSWSWPTQVWSRLHIDFLGPFCSDYYLVVIDAHSKWIEVEKVKTTSAPVIVGHLRKMFARFGLPKRIVSDNGPPFSSSEFATYLLRNGIKHTLIAPYHPASNGAAENAVRSIKRVLKKAQFENEDPHVALSRFLFTYRNSEQTTTGREPAVLMMGRRLRGRLDLLRPDTEEAVRAAQLTHEQRREGALRVADPGDKVLLRDYSKAGRKWQEGVVTKRSSPVSYEVRTSDGRTHKRHVDQILTGSKTNSLRKSRHSLSQVPDESPVSPNCPKTTSHRPVEDIDTEEFYDSVAAHSADPASPGARSGSPAQVPSASVPDRSPRLKRKAALKCLERLHNA
ncbi:uncharacterized protein K02A2.6-like [Cydia amplana]|uniref:uncharacterized protein K02A2.6-like n=1 Tax=Cydia amplana TaxID=1869771 RepID=UPI002FE5D7EB